MQPDLPAIREVQINYSGIRAEEIALIRQQNESEAACRCLGLTAEHGTGHRGGGASAHERRGGEGGFLPVSEDHSGTVLLGVLYPLGPVEPRSNLRTEPPLHC